MGSELQNQKKPMVHGSAPKVQQLRRSRIVGPEEGDRSLNTDVSVESHQPESQSLGSQFAQAKRFGHHLSQIPATTPAQAKAIQRITEPSASAGRSAEEEEDGTGGTSGQAKAEGSAPLQRAVNFGRPGPGESMPKQVRAKMENSFGTSFGDVQIHQNSMQAKSVGALAYTQGNQIHFAPGQYNPKSLSGQALLGHELTHVVQQRAGRVPVPAQSKGAPINADPALENEADVMGARAARGQFADVPGAPTAQRKEKPVQQKAEPKTQHQDSSEHAEQPVQQSQQPVQFFLAMLLPMLMPMIQQMLPQILQSVMGAGGGAGGGGGGS
ncbi:MAG: DUF4157 domain-containing protein [Leptolyngbyaceae bacterium]|nr:DUF4157 domain-containing protein [Leptolyngbyaceae bacterium]